MAKWSLLDHPAECCEKQVLVRQCESAQQDSPWAQILPEASDFRYVIEESHQYSRIHALLGIVEYDSNGISVSRSQATDTMPKIDAIGSPLALNRAVMNGECHCVALAQRNNFRPRLPTRALFGEYKLSTREIGRGIG